jgi:hypothetical protein
MWLFTQYGFFSVVAARQDGGHSVEIDPDTLQVRARVRTHLEALCKRFDALHGSTIIETPKADYLFRILVPRDTWGDIAGDLVGEIDYPNFKSACMRRLEPRAESPLDEYVSTLHEVWGATNALQGRVHGQGQGAYVPLGELDAGDPILTDAQEELLAEVRRAWAAAPEQRLLQLLKNAIDRPEGKRLDKARVFYYPDADLTERLREDQEESENPVNPS